MSTITFAGKSFGQDVSPGAVEFEGSGATHTWRRPPEVKYVLVSGCGGGGGGTGRYFGSSPIPGVASAATRNGLGGFASEEHLHLVKVTADAYTIVIGGGGAGGTNPNTLNDGVSSTGKAGGNTTFAGSDVSLTFSGGGSRSLFAPTQNVPSDYFFGVDNFDRTDGEGSSRGPGGRGAKANNESGTAAVIPCTGGGGAARQAGLSGGQGAPGFLTVFPLPDIARFARVLALLEDLSSNEEEQEEQN